MAHNVRRWIDSELSTFHSKRTPAPNKKKPDLLLGCHLGIGQERSLSSALAERATSHTKKRAALARSLNQRERETLDFFLCERHSASAHQREFRHHLTLLHRLGLNKPSTFDLVFLPYFL
jgi:hypothetical protein